MKKIVLSLILCILMIPLFSQVPITDTFDSGILNESLWDFLDPVGDCSITVVGGNAEIEIPAGTPHDLWTAGDAPRLLQSVSDIDFSIEVKLSSTPDTQYQMQGIIVQNAINTFIRFCTYSDGSPHLFCTVIIGGGSPSNKPVPDITVIPHYLRVSRSGNNWTYSYSDDGVIWNIATTFEQAFTVTEVGFYGGTAGSNPAYTAMADYFWNLDEPLPVNLSSFYALFIGNIPTVYWVTQSETNNEYWNVYRGTSDNFTEAIYLNANDPVSGNGTTNSASDYVYVDNMPVAQNTTYWYWIEDVSYDGETEIHEPITLTIPFDEVPHSPKTFGLHQNYPNPFNPSTSISFELKEESDVELNIYNIKGSKIRTIFSDHVNADQITYAVWDGNDEDGKQVSSGVYLYKLITDTKEYQRKMILAK